MAHTALSPLDAAWYHMDGPANTAIVTGLLLTHQPLDPGKLRALLKRRLLAFDRFRQRVVERGFPLATPHWEDVPDLDIDAHMHRVALPAPHDEAALRELASELAAQPLDPTRPLWTVHLVERVGRGSAMILRYHHCIGDGTAMMTVAAGLFQLPSPPPPPTARRRGAAAPPAPGLTDSLGLVLKGTASLVTELLKWPDPRSPFKGDFGLSKRVAWSAPVAIAEVKAVAAPSGAKVNDVLVAAVSGALRDYLRRRGVDVDHTSLRAMVPLDLRPPARYGALGNEFGLVILDLPVAESSARRRLASTQAAMDAIKRSPQALAMRLLLDIFGRGPKTLEDLACQVFGSKTSLVLTNVMGPREPVRLAGATVERMMFCVPHPGEQLGMGISILSYDGQATLTVVADARLVPDPETITRRFNLEFAALRRRAAAASLDVSQRSRTRPS
ncbi:MAG: wax ester/triacylglycerol synthase family O-acyltransferase [Burkholderiaceae bacterium]|nr:wax ester/triacylglycerol synthase family O-acyltransferase [Burkholderiaceae bacterium]